MVEIQGCDMYALLKELIISPNSVTLCNSLSRQVIKLFQSILTLFYIIKLFQPKPTTWVYIKSPIIFEKRSHIFIIMFK